MIFTTISIDLVLVTCEVTSYGAVEILGSAIRQPCGRWQCNRFGLIPIGTADTPQAAAKLIIDDAAGIGRPQTREQALRAVQS